ncbi:MAG: hypothetical protein OXL96_01070 [Candidatus Poribacteria bacterium]|nr:hypothetical protein [Candidatus Poribacteria bacterium]
MTRITEAERVFLSRAEAVTEKKRTRAAHYEQQLHILIAELQPGNVSKVSRQILEIATKLEKTKAQQDAHIQKVNALRAKQHADRSVIRLCADANTIAGTDGANFFTKAGKVFTKETPYDRTDDSTGKQTTGV